MSEFILGTLVAQLYVQLEARKATAFENTLSNAIFIAAVGGVFVSRISNMLRESP